MASFNSSNKIMKPTAEDIYVMCMESRKAYEFAEWLCAQAGITFPPVKE